MRHALRAAITLGMTKQYVTDLAARPEPSGTAKPEGLRPAAIKFMSVFVVLPRLKSKKSTALCSGDGSRNGAGYLVADKLDLAVVLPWTLARK